MTKPSRREFLLLAQSFDAEKHDPVGMLMSEKLDGNRCWWDGGVSRGVPTVSVPWASVLNPKKPSEVKAKIKPVATGLWSRYGNSVQAPEWFLDAMPVNVPLDGELYAGHGKFQYVQKAVRRDVSQDEQWKDINFCAFAAPTYSQVFQDGLIKNANFYCEINLTRCLNFIVDSIGRTLVAAPDRTFTEEIELLHDIVLMRDTPLLTCVKQTRVNSLAQVMDETKRVCGLGGEGVMLRSPDSVWYPKRRNFILKCKPRRDSEATIVGFVAGRTGKTGQFLGKLGTLVVDWNGVVFELGTGLTHRDRDLYTSDSFAARAAPGKPMPEIKSTPTFRLGDEVTFSYRELSDEGTPKEGAYLRIRNES